MPNPRNIRGYENLGYQGVTFAYDSTIVYSALQPNGSVSVGLAVTIVSNGTVGLCADADPVHGKLISVHADGNCTVQVDGGVVLPGGLAATLTPKSKIVGALGAASAKGYIRSVAAATLAEVAVARGFIIDSATATAVAVWLD